MPLSDNLILENAQLLYRNFSGAEREFNSEGDRNFLVKLDPKQAAELKEKGWRVKQMKPRPDEDEGQYILKVNVNYKKGRPPRIVTITSKGRQDLGADEIFALDYIDLANVDIVLNGWWSDMAGGGMSAFLKSGFFTIDEDRLDLKYADVPDANPTKDSSSTANETVDA